MPPLGEEGHFKSKIELPGIFFENQLDIRLILTSIKKLIKNWGNLKTTYKMFKLEQFLTNSQVLVCLFLKNLNKKGFLF